MSLNLHSNYCCAKWQQANNAITNIETTTMLLRNFLFRSKSDKEVWQEPSYSPYKNVIVAKGIYKDGKRVGIWVFTLEMAGTIQSYISYDYDENIVLIDASDQKMMECVIADNIKTPCSLIILVNTGAFLYNLPPVILRRELSMAIPDRFPVRVELNCSHTFILDLTGDIIKHKIRIQYEHIEKGYFGDKSMPDTEFKRFIPAIYPDYD